MLFHLLNEKDIRLLLQKFCPSIQKRGCEKAVLHQVIRTAKHKQFLMFFVWLGLLSQMQAFEHHLVEKL